MEMLDVVADVGDDPDVGCLLGQERGEGPQGLVGAADAAGAQGSRQLLQVAVHRCDDVRDRGAELVQPGSRCASVATVVRP